MTVSLNSVAFSSMTLVDLNNQLGVSLLAVIGSLVVRRIGLPERLQALIPTILCVVLFWLFVELPDFTTTLFHGAVSGLLAGGILYILLGLTRRS